MRGAPTSTDGRRKFPLLRFPHAIVFPSIAEDMAVARDAIIAEYTGTHVHIAHIASKGAVSYTHLPMYETRRRNLWN